MNGSDRNVKQGRKPDSGALVYALILGAALVFISYLGFVYHRGFRESLIQQWMQQLTTTEDIAALQMENFIAKFSANLVTVSHNPVVKQRTCDHDTSSVTELTYCPLFDLYNLHKDEIDAILLIDTNAMIVRRFPERKNEFLGQSCVNRIMVEKKLKEDEVYVSETFINKMGKASLTISCPVYNDQDELAGILRWMVTVEKIARRFVTPLRIGEGGFLWLVDEKGVIRYHPDSTLSGILLNDMIRDKDLAPASKFDAKLSSKDHVIGGPGDSDRVFTSPGKEDQIHIFRKVTLNNQTWTLGLTISTYAITEPVRQHARSTFLMESLILILFALFSYIFYRTQRRKSRLEVEARYLSEIAESAEKLRDERQKRLTAAIDGQEKERNRIARELHDGLGQYLVAAKVRISEMDRQGGEAAPGSIEGLKELSVMAIEEVKRISENLMPRMLDEFGLVTALKRLCEDTASNTGIDIDFVSYGITPEAEGYVRTHLYRIAQEALSNIVKHSKANHVDVQLLGNPGQVNLHIIDNGMGFDMERVQTHHGNGLRNIQERARILEGDLSVESHKGMGCAIRIKVAMQKDDV